MKFLIFLLLLLSSLITTKECFGSYVVAGVPNTFQTLDPTKSGTAHTRYALQLIYENLIKVNLNQELEPSLAKKWKINFSKNEILFELNTDHFFSNGDNVTAEDVVESFKKLCTKESQASTEIKGLKGCLEGKDFGAKALSKYSVSLVSEIHPSLLLYQLANLRVLIFKNIGNKTIGSGYYQVEELNKDYLKLKPNIFNSKKNDVKNDGVVFKFYPDEQSLLTSLQNNKIHLSFVHLTDGPKELNSNFNLITDLPYITQIVVFNNQRYPFNNEAIRSAIYQSIENETTFFADCRKIGSKPAFGIIPLGLGGSIAHIKNTFKNADIKPIKARPDTSVTIHQHKGRENACEANLLKNIFGKFNIKLDIKYHTDYETLWPLYLNHNLDGFIELFNFKNREAYSILTYFLTKGNNENYANINDLQLDQIITNALKSSTVAERFSWYRKANQRLRDKKYAAPLYYSTTKNYYHKCLKNVFHKPSFNPFPGITKISLNENCINLDEIYK